MAWTAAGELHSTMPSVRTPLPQQISIQRKPGGRSSHCRNACARRRLQRPSPPVVVAAGGPSIQCHSFNFGKRKTVPLRLLRKSLGTAALSLRRVDPDAPSGAAPSQPPLEGPSTGGRRASSGRSGSAQPSPRFNAPHQADTSAASACGIGKPGQSEPPFEGPASRQKQACGRPEMRRTLGTRCEHAPRRSGHARSRNGVRWSAGALAVGHGAREHWAKCVSSSGRFASVVDTSSAAGAASAFVVAIQQQLDELSSEGLYRQLRRVEGRPGPRMLVDGRECLMMASSNYLDLAGDPRVVAAAHDAGETFGTAAAGSRLINGNLALHETLEVELAAFLGFESSLVFSSGYLANLGVLTSLCGPDDLIVSDELNHASIIDGCRLSGARTRVFRHNDPDALADVLGQERRGRRRLVVLDGVFSMDGDVARLRELVPIAREHDALVILDDAHGIGILGASGRGTAEQEQVAVDVLIGNLGKALGSFGAFVACTEQLRDLLINTARTFVFTCALPAPALGAAREALRVVQREPVPRTGPP